MLMISEKADPPFYYQDQINLKNNKDQLAREAAWTTDAETKEPRWSQSPQ